MDKDMTLTSLTEPTTIPKLPQRGNEMGDRLPCTASQDAENLLQNSNAPPEKKKKKKEKTASYVTPSVKCKEVSKLLK